MKIAKMTKLFRNRMELYNNRNEYTYIEELFEYSPRAIDVESVTDKEWKLELEPIFTDRGPDENNGVEQVMPIIENKVMRKNNVEKQLADRERYVEKRKVSYKQHTMKLENGFDCRRKNSKRDKEEKKSIDRRLDEEVPVSWYLKDEYKNPLLLLVLGAEAILFYILIQVIFNMNPEESLAVAFASCGGLFITAMILAHESAKRTLDAANGSKPDFQTVLTLSVFAVAMAAYVLLRWVTRYSISVTEETEATYAAAAVLLMIAPVLCSLVAYKIEYHSATDPDIKTRRVLANEYKKDLLVIARESFPAIDTFNDMEDRYFKHLEKDGYDKIAKEIEAGRIMYSKMLIQHNNPDPSAISKVLNNLKNDDTYVKKSVGITEVKDFGVEKKEVA